MAIPSYTEANIRSLAWQEHLRLRPGMYIGKLGDGSLPDDGIYILIKEVIDNSVDEFVMGYGKKIEIKIADDNQVSVRDFGRGIPLGKVIDCVAKINTGGKYDSQAFQKSVGLNGVGIKVVNALSEYCKVQSFRDGLTKSATFSAGVLLEESEILATNEPNGTHVIFKPDCAIFKQFSFVPQFIEEQIAHYTFLNTGLIFNLNGKRYHSRNGLLDLLQAKTATETYAYPIIHFKKQDIELSLTHHHTLSNEVYYTFVNGQFTPKGGHLNALKEAIVQTVRAFYKKEFDAIDIRGGLIAALSIKVQDPIFESQTKTKLGSQQMGPEGPTIRSFIIAFIKSELDNYLHKNPSTAEILQKRILQSERERKEIAGIKKLVHEKTKKANLHNKKLRDCHIHFNSKHPNRVQSTIFITEGNSASGSITKSRNVETQAVFSLRGKPLNCFGQSKKLVYENEEFNLLQHALNIANGLDGLRYNKIVIATDADVDGMHIRLLILTYFLQFFPELVYNGHLYILETPLFRVRNRKATHYCYNEQEKEVAIKSLGAQPEITRFKGLGEISPDEFAHFIGAAIRLVPVTPATNSALEDLLTFYMGKNTPERRNFIIHNLRIEENLPEL